MEACLDLHNMPLKCTVHQSSTSLRAPHPKNLLVEGVRAGHLEWVEAAFASGATTDIQLAQDDITVPNGSLLALAAAQGHDHLVPILLGAGVDVDDGGELGYTPLQAAVHKGHDRVVDELMKAQPKRPNVDAQDIDGVSTLHIAARKDRVYCAKVLIEAGADINARDKSLRTPLHVSVYANSTSIMRLLLDAGCDANAINDKGLSVLHIAALCGNEIAVQELRMAGFEADGKDTMGLTPEDIADTWGSHGTAWLLRKMPKATITTNTIDRPYCSEIMMRRSWEEYELEGKKTFTWMRPGKAYLLEANTPINRDPHYQDEAGLTPMHRAAELGLTLMVRALSNFTCSYAGAVTYAGNTPAQLAERAGHTLLAQELSSMASVKDDRSPLELYWKLLITISTSDDVGEAGKLLSSGAPLHATKDLHTDAMVLAITCNRPRIVTLLAAAGAPLTTISGNFSLLQVAWLTPDVTIRVKVLITRIFLNVLKVEQDRVQPQDSLLRSGIGHLLDGLRSDAPGNTAWPFLDKDYSNLTSFMVAAARNNCPLTATFLKLCGGMAFKQDDGGTTPLHAALETNHLGMARAMVRNLGACPYVADSKGNLPLNLLQPDMKKHVEEVMIDIFLSLFVPLECR
ncbi:Ankyrin-1 [Portunus trituberculatus]|uniref:Ankyrin-1 n=1 Tax=Portunus trituberculatus TaxID=210409 RepID=A0A5B7GCU4_PORTR|nr:Ankyrin-1 [Portunus trituberculatus]